MVTPIEISESVKLPTAHGEGRIITFANVPDGKDHLALAFGEWTTDSVVNVRIHSECVTGDVFASKRCDCGPQLAEALATFARSSGVILYLRQEGRGIGLTNKLKAYRLQDEGLDTYEANRALGLLADAREFDLAVAMLKALGITRVRLLSNNPRKANALSAGGIRVEQRRSTGTYVFDENRNYLAAKLKRGGHDGLDRERIGVE